MNQILKKPITLLLLIVVFTMTISGSAFAHSNQSNKKNSIDVATAVSLIVKGLDLNLGDLRFIKAPQVSDYFSKIKDNAPYAQSFIIAAHNGLGLPKDINPSAKVTKEQFAKWLFGAMSYNKDYVWTQVYQKISDDNQVTKEYMDSIQKLLSAKIITLDNKQKLYPKSNITKSFAVTVIERTAKYIKNTQPAATPILTDVKLTSDKETDAITRVTISATAPHPGYGIEITSIKFEKGTATINYKTVLPDPDKVYIQITTEVNAVTYIPSSYQAVLGKQQ
ncbi:S-layer homology domain-containing protein [Cohnella abietis]|uniref:SLH domain-containing protein n=1 Tax=Cohnella abietis TaxID=2507935 RepID=A0A3T1D977_9BACL|nr:S-layer homology domain-containing protein [Cohnella abietis]BBI34629.1 hypothetical protein KCTCHS21_40280 [Cohnella abietis]